MLGVAVPRAAAQSAVQLQVACPASLPSGFARAWARALELDGELSATLHRVSERYRVVLAPDECTGPAAFVSLGLEREDGIVGTLATVALTDLETSIRARFLALWVAEQLSLGAAVIAARPDDPASAGSAVARSGAAIDAAASDAAASDAAASDSADDARSTPAHALGSPRQVSVAARVDRDRTDHLAGPPPPALHTEELATPDPVPIDAPEPFHPPTTAQVDGDPLLRGTASGGFLGDVNAGIGGGGDLRLELGVRGKPGFVGELSTGLSAFVMPSGFNWNELTFSLGGAVDVRLSNELAVAFGVRVIGAHEILVQVPAGTFTPPVLIDDGLELRASGFAVGRFYLYEGLAILVEAELRGHLVALLGGDATTTQENGLQLIGRVGLSLD